MNSFYTQKTEILLMVYISQLGNDSAAVDYVLLRQGVNHSMWASWGDVI